jgi:hypothetical protein
MAIHVLEVIAAESECDHTAPFEVLIASVCHVGTSTNIDSDALVKAPNEFARSTPKASMWTQISSHSRFRGDGIAALCNFRWR